MISQRDLAQRLDITEEMAAKHGLTALSERDIVALENDPPAWLLQSRANRKKGARPVWATLTCDVCGHTETVRPKKWWPAFTYLSCGRHSLADLPAPKPGQYRAEFDGVGNRFFGVVDDELDVS